MNYNKALIYLSKFLNYEKFSNYNYRSSYSLDRVERLLMLLDNPQKRYPSVIISGTKGKGSTATILASILDRAGIKTGLFTSPHLISVRERIKISRILISKREFSSLISLIKKVIEKEGLSQMTYFEIITSLALLYFADRGVDLAILEVGLGGRLDATNAAGSQISALTPISYDHTHLLGSSIEKIAKEKCGIIKRGSFVVSAPQKREALAVIKDRIERERGDLLLVGKAIRCSDPEVSIHGTRFNADTPYSSYSNLRVSLIGTHQAINSLTALGIVEGLRKRYGFEIREEQVRSALGGIESFARFQIVSKSPYIVLDGAQNGASAKVLKDTFIKIFGREHKVNLILGISSDKDIEAIGSSLCPLADSVIFTRADSPRAMQPAVLAQRLGRLCKDYSVAYDVRDALIFAKDLSSRKDIILIAGSLFLAGDALRQIKKGGYDRL